MASKYDGMTVAQILRLKKGGLRAAPLPPGSPAWEDLSNWVWEDVDAAAKANQPGFKTIRKLLTDGRFDR